MVASKVQSAKKDKKVQGRRSGKGEKPQTSQARAGLLFPVSRFTRMMRRDALNHRIGKRASVAMTSVVEYVTSELLEISGNLATEAGKKRINNRHLYLAIQQDDELGKLFHNIVLRQGGVLPKIEAALLPQKKGAKGRAAPTDPSQEV